MVGLLLLTSITTGIISVTNLLGAVFSEDIDERVSCLGTFLSHGLYSFMFGWAFIKLQ